MLIIQYLTNGTSPKTTLSSLYFDMQECITVAFITKKAFILHRSRFNGCNGLSNKKSRRSQYEFVLNRFYPKTLQQIRHHRTYHVFIHERWRQTNMYIACVYNIRYIACGRMCRLPHGHWRVILAHLAKGCLHRTVQVCKSRPWKLSSYFNWFNKTKGI